MSINFINSAIGAFNLSLLENNPAGQGIGSMVANDTAGGQITYSLSGDDAEFFSIDGLGVIHSVRSFNYEQPLDNNGNDNQYDIIISAESDGGSISQAVTVQLLNGKETPRFSSANIVRVVENTAGDFYQILADNISQIDRIISYQLTGTDAEKFSIDSATGQISFISSADFENPADADGNNAYDVVAVINAAGPNGVYAVSQNVQVRVGNQDDNLPYFISNSSVVSLNENNGNSFYHMADMVRDADGNDFTNYQLLQVGDANLFKIDSNGNISAKQAFNYETDRHVYSIVVAATSGSEQHVVSQMVQVNLQNVVETPGFQHDNEVVSVYQNDQIITTLTAVDDEGGGIYSYKLIWGDVYSLQLDSVTGELRFANQNWARDGRDYYAGWVEATSTLGNKSYEYVRIDVQEGNRPLPPVAPAYELDFYAGNINAHVSENNAVNFQVGLYQASDNFGGLVSYNLASGDLTSFSINNNGGLLLRVSTDYETKTSYSVVVVATGHDANGQAHQISELVQVNIDNIINEGPGGGGGGGFISDTPPVWLTPLPARQLVIEGDNATGVFVKAKDTNGVYDISYSLSDSNFSLNAAGQIIFINTPDYENPFMPKIYSLTVTAQGVDSTAAAITMTTVIEVVNKNDNTAVIYDDEGFDSTGGIYRFPFKKDEDAHQSLMTYSTGDADGGLVRLSLSDNVNFSIDQNGAVKYIGPQYTAGGQEFYTVQVIATSLYQPSVGDLTATNVVSLLAVVEFIDRNNFFTPSFVVGFPGNDGLLTIAENNALGISLAVYQATDFDAGMISYTVSDNNFSIDQNGVLYFNSVADYETKTDYSVVVSATSQGDVASKMVVLHVLNSNDNLPTLSGANSFSILENNNAGISLGIYQASDADGIAVVYSVNDNNFSINQNGVLYFNSVADYETKTDYSVVVSATSQGDVASKMVVLRVLNANDNLPTLSGANSFSILENNNAGISLGIYQASDADGSAVIYSVSDNNFSINQNGVLYFNSVADYETKTDYSVVVSATSQGDVTTKMVVLHVLNSNDNVYLPQFVAAPSRLTLLENNAEAVSLAQFSAFDANSTEVNYYLSNDIYFSISQQGALSFLSVADYEQQQAYSVVVFAVSGGDTISQAVTLDIANSNDSPTEFVVGKVYTAMGENNPVGTVTTQLRFRDADGGSISYTISDNVYFSIDQNGNIYNQAILDYEQQVVYSLTVTAISQGQPNSGNASNQITQLVVVQVVNRNDNDIQFLAAPNRFAINNQNTAGIGLGQFVASDADGGTVLYRIDDYLNFSIDQAGELYFSQVANYQQQSRYSVVVTAVAQGQPLFGAGNNNISQLVILDINNITSSVSFGYSQDTVQFSLNENNPFYNFLGNVALTDPDGGAVSYMLTSSDFSVETNGDLYFNRSADFETKNIYSVTLFTSTNAGRASSQMIVLNVLDVYEPGNDHAPQFISGQTNFSITENNVGITTLGQYQATDVDGGNISYSLSNNNMFALDAAGNLKLLSRLNYEQQHSYSVVITAHSYKQPAYGSASNDTTLLVTISVGNVNDNAPQFTPGFIVSSILENQSPGQSIAQYSAYDLDGGNISYSIMGDGFSIDQSGVVYFTTTADYETKNIYVYTVVATSYNQPATGGALSSVLAVGALNIGNQEPEDRFIITTDTAQIIDENSGNTYLGDISGQDSNGGTISYWINDTAHFALDAAGAVYAINNFDYEQQRTATLVVYASSTGRADVISKSIFFAINNVNDNDINFVNNPALAPATITIAENNQAGVSIGQYVASDADGGGVNYSINDSHFSIDSNGVLFFSSSLDYEAGRNYSVVITATATNQPTGGANNVVSKLVTLNITNSNDNPITFVNNLSALSLAENNATNISVGNYQAFDIDGGGVFYSVDNSTYFSINSNGVVYFKSVADYEAQKYYSVTVTANALNQSSFGNAALSVTQLVVLNILNQPENNNAPSFTVSQILATSIYEGTSAGMVISQFQATDLDGGGISYSVVAPSDFPTNPLFSIDQNGIVYLASDAIYETRIGGWNYPAINSGYYYYYVVATSTNQPSAGQANNVVSVLKYLQIVNINDEQPYFYDYNNFQVDNGTLTVSASENNPADLAVATLYAADLDSGGINYTINDPAHFRLASDFAGGYRAIISLISSADYETQNIYSVILTARSNNQPAMGNASNDVSKLIILTIGNVAEDNSAPNFLTAPGHVSLAENNLSGLSLAQFVATDADGGAISYYINDNTNFSIDQAGTVYFKSVADYETVNTYSLVVTAHSQNQIAGGAVDDVSQTLVVHLQDMWENFNAPTFVSPVLSVSINENIAVGQLVTSFVALDLDGAIDNNGNLIPVPFSYSLNDNVHFSIDNNGQLYVKNVDYETARNYSLVVTATSLNQPIYGPANNNVSTLLTVGVINDNDNSPIFYNDMGQPLSGAQRTIAYSDSNLTSVAVFSAVDADGGAISYSVSDAARFSINANGQLIYIGSAFNNTAAHFTLVVTAQSTNQPATGGASNVVSLLQVVDVLDPNQSSYQPQFAGLTNGYTYSGQVFENNSTPLLLATFAASDAAGTAISYYLTNDNGNYSISQDGKLYLLTSADAESVNGNFITGLRINATTADLSRGGAGNLTSWIRYNLWVLNVDDNKPVFPTANYNYSINENNVGSVYLGTLGADPVDILGYDNTIYYSVSDNSNFAITYYGANSSMDLSFIGNANYEAQSLYSVIVTATTIEAPALNQVSQLVVLHVNNLNYSNNNPIVFNSNVNSFNINEKNNANVFLGNLAASDLDVAGAVGGISYSIQGVDSASFSIAKYTGDLTFIGRADYETQNNYSIILTAKTSEQPDAISKLVVLHINDVAGVSVSNDTAANFTSGLVGTAENDQFTIYYAPGGQPWTGGAPLTNTILLRDYNPTMDHITLNSFANSAGISGGIGGVSSLAGFENYLNNNNLSISLLGGDINVPLSNDINLFIDRVNDNNGNDQAFLSPSTGLANGNISFAEFLQLLGGASHVDFVG